MFYTQATPRQSISDRLLAANAYMITGDDHYRDWALEYLGAWLERTEANGGIIPSNVGPSGRVGEKHQGRWYEGFFGWNYWFGGWGIVGRGMRIGFSNAFLLSGDVRYLDALRSQGDALLKNRQGPVFLNKYGDKGWYEEANVPDYPRKALTEALERVRLAVGLIDSDRTTPDTRRADTPHGKQARATYEAPNGVIGAVVGALVNLTMGGRSRCGPAACSTPSCATSTPSTGGPDYRRMWARWLRGSQRRQSG